MAALQKEYPYLHGVLGEALKLVSEKADRDSYPLWWIISQNDEARWERNLKRVAEILKVKDPAQLKELYDLSPNDLSGNSGRFRNFVGEIQVLFELADNYNFERFEKIPKKRSEPTPDYFARFGGVPFTVEVCHTIGSENKEKSAYDGRVYDITHLLGIFEGMVKNRLPKFRRQLSAYPGYKKLAAMVYERMPATATFLNENDAAQIGQRLWREAEGTIDYFLITSGDLQPSSYIVPDPRQY